MKTKNKKNIDVLKEIKNSAKYQSYSEAADLRIRLALEVYKNREILGLSQSDLAKKAGTTQRIISNIESAEINIGIELFYRLSKELNFGSVILSKIFNRDIGPYSVVFSAANSVDVKKDASFENNQKVLSNNIK